MSSALSSKITAIIVYYVLLVPGFILAPPVISGQRRFGILQIRGELILQENQSWERRNRKDKLLIQIFEDSSFLDGSTTPQAILPGVRPIKVEIIWVLGALYGCWKHPKFISARHRSPDTGHQSTSPCTSQPSTGLPGTDQPGTGQPVTSQLITSQLGTRLPGADQPDARRIIDGQLGTRHRASRHWADYHQSARHRTTQHWSTDTRHWSLFTSHQSSRHQSSSGDYQAPGI